MAEGPHNKNDSGHGWTYFADLDSKSPKALYAPGRGRRIIGEWNDGSWQGKKFGPTWEGPDLWLDVTVPPGTTRVSLYTFNVTGGSRKADRRRDYGLEVRRYAGTVAESMTGPVLARARTVASENPAYRSFLLGGGRYWIRMAGNYSFVVSLSGVYFDRMGPGTGEDATAHYLQGVEYAPPAAAGSGSDQATAAQELWASLDQAWGRAGAVGMQAPYRVLAYRAALAGGASADVLANWRWALHLWTTGDRAEWGHVMAESKKRLPAAATRVSNEE